MITLRDIRDDFHNQVLRMRSMERILESREFEQAFKKANEKQIDLLHLTLMSHHVDAARQWIRDLIEEPLGLRSYRALRDLAKNENVPRYSRLNRDQLIRALEKKRDL
jgi:hypothetical protein